MSAPETDRPDAAAVPARPPAGAREAWIDVFRGVAIIAVCLIHILPRFYRLHTPGSYHWWAVFGLQRVMFFAVPSFLLLSAMVNTASLLRRPGDLKGTVGFWKSRLGSVVWPYLAWSGLYIAYQVLRLDRPLTLNWLANTLRWGIAWPHLYFMVALMQLLVILPLLAALLRLSRPPRPFPLALLLALTLAALIYLGNRTLLHFTHPATMIVWHVLPVTLGIWLGGEGVGQARTWLRRNALFCSAVMAAVGAFYVDIAARSHLGLRPDTMHYQAAEWGYAAAAAFALLGISARISDANGAFARTLTAGLSYLGANAFAVYLAHPFVLIALDHVLARMRAATGEWVTLLACTILTIALPLVLALVVDRLRLGAVLFGRAAPKRPPSSPPLPVRDPAAQRR